VELQKPNSEWPLIEKARKRLEAAIPGLHSSGDSPLFQGRYSITGELGRGGFATVYQAFDTKLPRFVAIKLTSKTVLEDPSKRRRFEHEIKATAALSHAHVVTIHDADITTDGSGYLVMEYMAGGTVKQAVSEEGPFEWQRFIGIAVGLASGLECIHGAGFVHRDIKHENVLFWAGSREIAKLADLGIVHVPHSDATAITEPGWQPGTPLWMAPEQLEGEDPVPESDIYSLGATFYFMLTGRCCKRPPAGLNLLRLIRMLPELPIVPLEESGKPIPPQLVKVVHRCLERDPRERFSSATKLKEALSAIAAPKPSPSRPVRRPRSPAAVRELEVLGRQVLAVPKRARVFTLDDFRVNDARPGDMWISSVDGAEMVFIPAGSFIMGDADGNLLEQPVHRASTGAFLIDRFPVTNARYKRFLDAMPDYPVPSGHVPWARCLSWDERTRTFPPGFDDFPVVLISFDDARAYAAWARKRLPTEAEWEKAASWDPETCHHRRYPWGDEWDTLRANSSERVSGRSFAPFRPGHDEGTQWYNTEFLKLDRLDPTEANSYELLTRVWEFPDGASACGVMDMAGNVHEWCETDVPFRSYGGLPDPLRVGEDQFGLRAARGGSWGDHPHYLRTSARYSRQGRARYDRAGFRCVARLQLTDGTAAESGSNRGA